MRIWCHFKCGCVVPRDKVIDTYIGKSRIIYCLKHKDLMSHRSARCTNGCKEIFTFSSSGRIPLNCKNCGVRLDSKGVVSCDPEKYIYCIFRDQCLLEAALKNRLHLNCASCERFVESKPLEREESYYESTAEKRCCY